jgi:ribose transport system permease protein
MGVVESMPRKTRNIPLSKLLTPALLIAMLLFFGIQYPTFLAGSSIMNLLRQMSIRVIAAMGMSMIILMGSIDVSVGATLTFSGTIAALSIPLLGWSAIFLGIITGSVIGLSNGFIATRLKIPTFLSTIAVMGILNGASALILKGSPFNITSKVYLDITKGHLIPNVSNIIPISISVILITIFILRKTMFGRSLYLIGGDAYVSQYAGINVPLVQILAFTIHGTFAGLAGSLQASVLEAACPFMGDPYTLSVIAVVVMGGIPLSGGKGGALGTVLGTVLITILASGMNFMGVTPEVRDVAMGFLIILGASTTQDRSREISIK